MAHKLLVAPEAISDITIAALWYDSQRQHFGDIYLLAIQDIFNAIQRYPKSYPIVVDDIRRALVSRFPYAALYRLRNENIEILAVLHHRQHSDTLFARLMKNP